MTSSPYLTVPEVAGILRCHEKTVRRMISRGEFRAEYVAGRWLVRECDLPGFMPPRPLLTPPSRSNRGDVPDGCEEPWCEMCGTMHQLVAPDETCARTRGAA